MYDYAQLIRNASEARNRAESDWGKKYWTDVIDHLLKKWRKDETVD